MEMKEVKWREFTFNCKVRITLTDIGKKIAEDAGCRHEEDDLGRSVWQMWEIANVFGEHMFLGNAGVHPFSAIAEVEE